MFKAELNIYLQKVDFWFSYSFKYLTSVCFQVIDASQSIEDVHDNIRRHSLNAINTAERTPLGELWKSVS